MADSLDSLGTGATLEVSGTRYRYHSLTGGELAGHPSAARLPVSAKILLENLLRHEDGVNCTRDDIEALAGCRGRSSSRIGTDSRVLSGS